LHRQYLLVIRKFLPLLIANQIKRLASPIRGLVIISNFSVIWKEQVARVVAAASRRDHFISRLKAAPTGIFFRNLGFPDKRLNSLN
jgi:hypothetical protein